MKTGIKIGLGVALALVAGMAAGAPAHKIATISRDPYIGAIAVDAATGKVLFEANADGPGYPASCIKLMNILIILEKIQQGAVHLSDAVTVNAETSHMGGSRVYLKENEVFTVEELMYALMVQSANDAAVALADQVAGSKGAFVELMNQRAQQLGMKSTHFYSVHGLPPGAGQLPDVSSCRDLALLARELISKHPEILQYTATRERGFRDGKFIMRTHNHLLGAVAGCDGLKTGYFTAAGFSIVATAQRDGRRVIAVVLGSRDRLVRDARARELLEQGIAALPPVPVPAPAASNALPSIAATNRTLGAATTNRSPVAAATNGVAVPAAPVKTAGGPLPERTLVLVLAALLVVAVGFAVYFASRSRSKRL